MLTVLLEKHVFNYWCKICGKIGHYPHNTKPFPADRKVITSRRSREEKREEKRIGKGARRKIVTRQQKQFWLMRMRLSQILLIST